MKYFFLFLAGWMSIDLIKAARGVFSFEKFAQSTLIGLCCAALWALLVYFVTRSK